MDNIHDHCPLKNTIGDEKEIRNWIHGMSEVKAKVDSIDKKVNRRPKTGWGSWASLILAAVIFIFGAVYTAGIQQNRIDTNTQHIEQVQQNVVNANKNIQANKEILIKLEGMADDIKDIKSIIFEQLKQNK